MYIHEKKRQLLNWNPMSLVWASLVAQESRICWMQKTQERWVRSLGQEIPMEKGMATPAPFWRMPWAEEPGRLQSVGSHSWTRLKWHSMHARTPLVWLEHGTTVLLPAKYDDPGCRLGLRASCPAESSAFLCFLSFLARSESANPGVNEWHTEHIRKVVQT